MAVVVVEEAEERGELLGEAWEERHFVVRAWSVDCACDAVELCWCSSECVGS